MPSDHEVQLKHRLVYETASNIDGNKHTDGAPHRMKWSDLRGTRPERFKHALEQLERLCYAVYGARPLQYNPTYIDWDQRLHPRCLWGPEQWKEIWCGGLPPPHCDERYFEFKEYGALGDNTTGIATPVVPSKSRSGDPMLQFLDEVTRTHVRAYFPVGSVARTGTQSGYAGNETHDPKGTGDFGGDPANIGHDGPIHFDGDPVVVSWAPPAGAEWVPAIDSVKLRYRVLPASSFEEVSMTDSGGVWSGTIPAQDHGSEVEWYIELEIHPPVDPWYTVYEPGGLQTPPTSGTYYRYVAFTHWSPYPYGLPELWSRCAKGTDRYEFAPDETIQPGLINLARFILDTIGRRFNHNPKSRPEPPECCFDMRIKWRWSGSAPWPHLVGGGKDADFHSPLHNLDDPQASNSLARRSWRGADHWYANSFEQNYGYGLGASWLSIPERLTLERWDAVDPDACAVYFKGEERGMREGDVIEAAHIEEIIQAVDYLVKQGLWELRPIKRRMITPDWAIYDGHPCGQYHNYGGAGPDNWRDYRACCQGGNADPNTGPCDDPYDPPIDWDDCWNNGPWGVCTIGIWYNTNCRWDEDQFRQIKSTGAATFVSVECSGGFMGFGWTPRCEEGCLGNFSVPSLSGGAVTACGCVSCKQETWVENIFPDIEISCQKLAEGLDCGWAAYVCGPQRCPNGCDASHGNGWWKTRYDHDCPFPDFRMTGNSHGNCFGEIYSCAENVDTGLHDDMDFETVTRVWFHGAGQPFLQHAENRCGYTCPTISNCGAFSYQDACFADSDFPEIPGLSGHRDPSGEYFCGWDCFASGEGCDDCGHEYGGCHCAVDECNADSIWAALDLKIDNLTPYANHPDHPYPTPPGGGGEWDLFPNLAAYDPNPDPGFEPLWTDCPCETWTSEWGPFGQWSGDGSCVHDSPVP